MLRHRSLQLQRAPNALVDLALGRIGCSNSSGDLGMRTVEILEALYASASSGAAAAIDTG